MKTYRRPPVVFTRGHGCRVYDSRGREYLDFLGGIAVNALGHAHPRMVRVICREAGRATHVSNLFHNAYQAPLARKLAEWSGLDRVFFANSGTEAIEGALKLARAHSHGKATRSGSPKTRILALENSFHGRTMGALSITHTPKYREPFAPLIPGVEFEAFWRRARELATQHDAALIADEIQSGLGRTGRKFAYQKFASLPDIVTVAKPLAGGLPLGGFVASERFASAFAPGSHGSTFGGGPLVCAAALEFLTIVEDGDLLANIRARGAELREGLEKLAARFDFIRELRGEGLIVGIDLSLEGAPFVEEALRRGLLINCTHEHILRLLPPFIIRARDVAEFLAKFETVLARGAKSAKKWPASAPMVEAHPEPLAVAATR
jgi:acetylornithine/N-succinyldiaminopimelate aminotransferase